MHEDFKKIDQVFVLSDSSVNVYGFRLLTAGYQMDEFLKNPIGYYNHLKDDGVLVRWEDVKLDGDKVIGTPVINMAHPRAARTIKEIENGFLNAASVGHLCLLDYEFEDNAAEPDKPTLVGLKWYNKECSLVDSPGNRSAFKAGLYDADDKEINLSDLTEILKTKNSHMKEIKLAVTPALISLLGLSDEPSAAEVSKGITDLHDRAKNAEKGLQDLKDDAVQKEVNNLIDTAFGLKKITAEQKVLLAKDYAAEPTKLKSLLDSMVGFTPIAGALRQTDRQREGAVTEMTPQVKSLVDKGWKGLDKAGELKNLKDADEAAYKELYKTEFGFYPNESPAPKK